MTEDAARALGWTDKTEAEDAIDKARRLGVMIYLRQTAYVLIAAYGLGELAAYLRQYAHSIYGG